jgi:flagellar hook-associated protein 3 FlgL
MSIDRISTAQQTAYQLSQINKASAALDKTTNQISSGQVANTYAGFGTQAQVLQATISASARNDAYTTATSLATTQADMQDTQLTSLSSLATQLQTAVSNAVANNDPTTLMTTVSSIFDQASAILNSQDANGAYIYGGGNDSTAPVSVNSLSDLAALPSVSAAFTNGDNLKAVQVADGQTVTYGLTASSIGTGLMQELQSIAKFDQGSNGNFANSASLSEAQSTYLTGEISNVTSVETGLNNVTAQNGETYNQLKNATTQQGAMATQYSTFINNIQSTNDAQAATQLSLDQTALQAALQVTSTLNQLTLLNYLPAASTLG